MNEIAVLHLPLAEGAIFEDNSDPDLDAKPVITEGLEGILKVQAEAPGGLQEVQVYLEGRRVHVTRSSGGTSLSCENELCYDNSYSKKILDWSWRFTPVLIEFARAKSTVVPALLPWSLSRQAVDITGFADGAYEKYKCVIKSRDYWRDAVTVTKDFSPALNIARSTVSLVTASDIQYEGKDFFTVKFRPSVQNEDQQRDAERF